MSKIIPTGTPSTVQSVPMTATKDNIPEIIEKKRTIISNLH